MRNSTQKIKRYRKSRYGDGGKAVKIRTERHGLLYFKTVITLLLVALQACIFIGFYVFLGIAFWIYLVISFCLSLLTCIYCLSSNKNGLSKAVWIMLLLLGFSFGFILYFMSDERFFFYKAKKRYVAISERTAVYGNAYFEPNASLTVKRDCQYLYNSGKFAAFNDTSVKYFPSGAQLFDDVLERLESAEQFVFMEFFIVSDGALLDRLTSLLSQKAQSGVDVRLIYDDFGSHRVFSRKAKKRIKSAGIKLLHYHRLKPQFRIYQNYRDHRKMIIVDGKTAYTGGSNLADEYTNEKRMYGYWKDTGIRLDGKGVDGFTLIFLRQWEYLTKSNEDYSPYLNIYEKFESSSVVVPYADGLDFKKPIGKNVYENVISGANERLWIMTPYFVPDETITGLLKNKVAAGVDVRIILPGTPDKLFIYMVSRNNAEKLMECGVKIYCMNNSFVHSKLCLSENCAVVGSINFDLRSFYQQFECAVYTNDKTALSDIAKDFEDTFKKSQVIDETNAKRRKLYNRVIAGVLQVVAPLM
ncbi:MAG: cardiolipin synthase [Clostridia bacterium]|nr:cardiolipin synthase [Clostridia bacterium]